jgi:hypothetical protein
MMSPGQRWWGQQVTLLKKKIIGNAPSHYFLCILLWLFFYLVLFLNSRNNLHHCPISRSICKTTLPYLDYTNTPKGFCIWLVSWLFYHSILFLQGPSMYQSLLGGSCPRKLTACLRIVCLLTKIANTVGNSLNSRQLWILKICLINCSGEGTEWGLELPEAMPLEQNLGRQGLRVS